ncbi:iron ABC transporter permease [Halomonas sp. N3-2A]|nr:iron ABC transporter permease [Halomonas sp. N3-2A]
MKETELIWRFQRGCTVSSSSCSSWLVYLFSWRSLSIVLLILLALLIALPLVNLLLMSIQGVDGGFSLQGFRTFFSESEYLEGLFNSMLLAALVTLTASILGASLAYITQVYEFPCKRLLSLLPISIIVIPEIISVQSWLLVFGNNGVLTRALSDLGMELPSFYGWFGMVYVMTFTYYAYVYMAALSALKGFDRQLLEAATNLGLSEFQARLKVLVPLLSPAIISGALVVFTLVLGNFAIAMTLGHGIPLLSILTYKTFLSEIGFNPAMQSTLATVSTLLLVSVMLAQRWILGRGRYEMAQGRPLLAKRLTGLSAWLHTLPVLLVVIGSLLPLALLLVGAFTRAQGPVMQWGEWTLDNFERVWTYGMGTILNSLSFAALATLIGVILGTLVAYATVKKRGGLSPALEFIAMLPLAVSGTVLGIALAQGVSSFAVGLAGSSMLMVLAYSVRRLPFAVRNAANNLHNVDGSLEAASISLGVSPCKTFFKVSLPLMSAGIAAAGVLMWATSVAELNSSIVVYSAGQETLPIQIFRLIDSDMMAMASAYGVIMISLILLPVIAATRVFNLKLFA